jgi:uncharacterized RDD family membrane protein YckC
MNQQIIDFLQENKEEYTKESLIEQLRNAGYDNAEITDAVKNIYGDDEVLIKIPNDDIENNIKYAGFGIRTVASIIDMIVVMIVIIPFLLIFKSFIITNYFWSMILVPFGYFVLSLTYFLFMTDKYQATLGKKLFGLKVVNENTLQKAPFVDIMNREGISRVIFFIFMPIHLFVAFMAKKQGVHDMAANTVVIHNKENK